MTKSKTKLFILSGGALVGLALLAVFSAAVPRISIRTLAQRDQSNRSGEAPQQRPRHKRGSEQEAARALQEFQARFPTVDYDSPGPTNPEEKATRSKRNKHYDGKDIVMRNPPDGGSATIIDSHIDLPELPVAQSDVILTADVLSSEAHLSNNRNAVYSEFNAQVDVVLKGTVPTMSKTNLISLSRLGGVVRYPSGHKERYEIARQNMPAIGKRYLFFLKATEDPESYEIVTGYEIGAERVVPLDWGRNVESFRGTETTVFLNTVRDAIANKN